jgi:hypothetical protein
MRILTAAILVLAIGCTTGEPTFEQQIAEKMIEQTNDELRTIISVASGTEVDEQLTAAAKRAGKTDDEIKELAETRAIVLEAARKELRRRQ